MAEKDRMGHFESEAYHMFFGTIFLIVIAVSSAIIIPNLFSMRDKAKEAKTKWNISRLSVFIMQNNLNSKSQQEIKQAIINDNNYNAIIKDAYNNEITIRKIDKHLFLFSYGKNGIADTLDSMMIKGNVSNDDIFEEVK